MIDKEVEKKIITIFYSKNKPELSDLCLNLAALSSFVNKSAGRVLNMI